ncbi:MAG: hypothetical protein OEZ47_12820 [Gammaproteobacteria bacterium]|nr:hypothetical protein [Gammaproteobacteria bacterium]
MSTNHANNMDPANAGSNKELHEACNTILPTCTNNISTVREQGETATAALAQKISHLSRIIQTITKNNSNFSQTHSNKTEELRKQLSKDIRSAASEADKLRTQLVSIAEEINSQQEKLGALCEKVSQQGIENEIRSIHQALEQSSSRLSSLVQAADNDSAVIEQQFHSLVGEFREELKQEQEKNYVDYLPEMQEVLNTALEELQFQDRSNQILNAVQITLTKFIDHMNSQQNGDGNGLRVDIEHLLDLMRSHYVTHEQYENDQNLDESEKNKGNKGGDVYFF